MVLTIPKGNEIERESVTERTINGQNYSVSRVKTDIGKRYYKLQYRNKILYFVTADEANAYAIYALQ